MIDEEEMAIVTLYRVAGEWQKLRRVCDRDVTRCRCNAGHPRFNSVQLTGKSKLVPMPNWVY